MSFDPRRGCAVRLGVWDVECGVGNLARTGEALDVERVVGSERTEGQALRVQGGLVWHFGLVQSENEAESKRAVFNLPAPGIGDSSHSLLYISPVR